MKNFIFVLLLVLYSAGVSAQEADFSAPLQTKASPVVVELFSSQNCPACPPADAYMKDLAQSNGVIALSCHVDYFGKTSANLGREFCTDRQSAYIKQIGRKSHFTPQMMINGHMSEIGYERGAVSASLVKARAERMDEVYIKPKGNGVYDFGLLQQDLTGTARLWLAVYDKPKSVMERGKKTTYHNVIKRYIPLGDWNGAEMSRVVYPIIDETSAGFAIVAQSVSNGKIVAAGDYRF